VAKVGIRALLGKPTLQGCQEAPLSTDKKMPELSVPAYNVSLFITTRERILPAFGPLVGVHCPQQGNATSRQQSTTMSLFLKYLCVLQKWLDPILSTKTIGMGMAIDI
jgi:hypothetical protein